jgi:hypothetical protein
MLCWPLRAKDLRNLEMSKPQGSGQDQDCFLSPVAPPAGHRQSSEGLTVYGGTLRRANSEFLQTTVKGASAQPEIFCSEQSISIVPGKSPVDQE